MINLTRQERLILAFIAFTALSGIALDVLFKSQFDSNRFLKNIFQSQDTAFKLNINSADKEELMRIKGIGPVLAQNIIDYRSRSGPLSRIDDIVYVRGIGPKKFQQIKDFIKID